MSSSNDGALLSSLASLYPRDDVVFTEVFRVINNFNGGIGCRSWISSLGTGVFRIILIILLKRYVTDPSIISDLFKKWGWHLIRFVLYRNRKYSNKDYQAIQLTPIGEAGRSINGLPLYVATLGDEVEVMHVPYVHAPYLTTLDQTANQRAEEDAAGVTKYFSWRGTRYSLLRPQCLFPSRNYVRLQEIIEKKCVADIHLRSYDILGILIDGVPGLGKTRALEFLANNLGRRANGTFTSGISDSSSKRIFTSASSNEGIKTQIPKAYVTYRIDMSNFQVLKMTPEKIFESCFHQIAIRKPSIFMIDEVDKYIDYYIKHTYTELFKQPLKKKSIMDDEIEIPMVASFEDHSKTVRTDFLYLILAILERVGNENTCVVIFCSNNFETIFGDLDMTHFDSLKSRFTRVRFDLCDSAEIVEYMRYNNANFEFGDLYEPNLEQYLPRLHPNISITYRTLREISVLTAYDPLKMIDALNLLAVDSSSPFNAYPISSSCKDPPLEPSTIVVSCIGSQEQPDRIIVSIDEPDFDPESSDAEKGVITKDQPELVDAMNPIESCQCGMLIINKCTCSDCQVSQHKCHWCVTGTIDPYAIKTWKHESSNSLDPNRTWTRILKMGEELQKLVYGNPDWYRAYLDIFEFISYDEVIHAFSGLSDRSTYTVQKYPASVIKQIRSLATSSEGWQFLRENADVMTSVYRKWYPIHKAHLPSKSNNGHSSTYECREPIQSRNQSGEYIKSED